MFTQCSKCETVFELSADILREAGGQVRCGHCGEIFNAFARLAEDDSAFLSGESSYDLESRADAILESSVGGVPTEELAHDDDAPEYDEAPPGVEIAHLRILDDEDSEHGDCDETAEQDDDTVEDDPAIFEFTLPPGELDRIFVEGKGMPYIALPSGFQPTRALASSRNGNDAASTASVKPLAPVTALPVSAAAARQQQSSAAPPLLTVATPASAAIRAAAALRSPGGGMTVPDKVRLEMLAGAASRKARAATLEEREAPPRPALAWWIGAIALSALLILQLTHENRQALASVGVVGPAVRAVYAKLGSDVALPVDLNAYQLRQWGVSAAPDSTTTLRVRASIMNISSQLKPYPLLRVSFANRFGAKLGTRNFEAAEYTGKPVVRMLSPGERTDATVDILDPGQEAEGFELNVCLRASDKTVACVGDNSAARTP